MGRRKNVLVSCVIIFSILFSDFCFFTGESGAQETSTGVVFVNNTPTNPASSKSVTAGDANNCNYKIGNLNLCLPGCAGTYAKDPKTDVQFLNQSIDIPIVNEIGDTFTISRNFYYWIDLTGYTTFDLSSTKATKVYSFPVWTPVSRDPNNPGVKSSSSIIVLEERAPANRWWSQSLDLLTYCDPPTYTGAAWMPKPAVQGSSGQLPAGGAPYIAYGTCGDYVNKWRAAGFSQASPSTMTGLDTDKIFGTNTQAETEIKMNVPVTINFDVGVKGDFNGTTPRGNIMYNQFIGCYSTLANYNATNLYSPAPELDYAVSSSTIEELNVPSSISASYLGNTVSTGLDIANDEIKSTYTFQPKRSAIVTVNKPMTKSPLLNDIKNNGNTFTFNVEFNLRPEITTTTKKVKTTAKYIGYYNPSTDAMGNLYYPYSAEVTEQSPLEVSVDNKVILQNVKYSVRICMEVRSVTQWKRSEIFLTPVAPSGVTISSVDRNITLKWNEIPNADYYHVYRSESPFSEKTLATKVASINASGSGTASWTENVGKDGTFYYSVSASNLAKIPEGTLSQNVYTKILQDPAIPVLKPIYSPSTDGKVNLAWNVADRASSYLIYRSNSTFSNVSPAISFISEETGKTYQDVLEEEGTFYYSIVSKNSFGTSNVSNRESVVVDFPTPPPPPPPVPSVPASPDAITDGILISWGNVAGASGYKVFMSHSPFASTEEAGIILDTVNTQFSLKIFFDQTDHPPGQYYFGVTAYNASGDGRLSNLVIGERSIIKETVNATGTENGALPYSNNYTGSPLLPPQIETDCWECMKAFVEPAETAQQDFTVPVLIVIFISISAIAAAIVIFYVGRKKKISLKKIETKKQNDGVLSCRKREK